MINIILSLFDSISDRARAKHLTKTNPDNETKNIKEDEEKVSS